MRQYHIVDATGLHHRVEASSVTTDSLGFVKLLVAYTVEVTARGFDDGQRWREVATFYHPAAVVDVTPEQDEASIAIAEKIASGA